MRDVSIDVDIDPTEVLDQLKTKEIITYLKDRLNIPDPTLPHLKPASPTDEEWIEIGKTIAINHRSLTSEEEEVIKNIIQRFIP